MMAITLMIIILLANHTTTAANQYSNNCASGGTQTYEPTLVSDGDYTKYCVCLDGFIGNQCQLKVNGLVNSGDVGGSPSPTGIMLYQGSIIALSLTNIDSTNISGSSFYGLRQYTHVGVATIDLAWVHWFPAENVYRYSPRFIADFLGLTTVPSEATQLYLVFRHSDFPTRIRLCTGAPCNISVNLVNANLALTSVTWPLKQVAEYVDLSMTFSLTKGSAHQQYARSTVFPLAGYSTPRNSLFVPNQPNHLNGLYIGRLGFFAADGTTPKSVTIHSTMVHCTASQGFFKDIFGAFGIKLLPVQSADVAPAAFDLATGVTLEQVLDIWAFHTGPSGATALPSGDFDIDCPAQIAPIDGQPIMIKLLTDLSTYSTLPMSRVAGLKDSSTPFTFIVPSTDTRIGFAPTASTFTTPAVDTEATGRLVYKLPYVPGTTPPDGFNNEWAMMDGLLIDQPMTTIGDTPTIHHYNTASTRYIALKMYEEGLLEYGLGCWKGTSIKGFFYPRVADLTANVSINPSAQFTATGENVRGVPTQIGTPYYGVLKSDSACDINVGYDHSWLLHHVYPHYQDPKPLSYNLPQLTSIRKGLNFGSTDITPLVRFPGRFFAAPTLIDPDISGSTSTKTKSHIGDPLSGGSSSWVEMRIINDRTVWENQPSLSTQLPNGIFSANNEYFEATVWNRRTKALLDTISICISGYDPITGIVTTDLATEWNFNPATATPENTASPAFTCVDSQSRHETFAIDGVNLSTFRFTTIDLLDSKRCLNLKAYDPSALGVDATWRCRFVLPKMVTRTTIPIISFHLNLLSTNPHPMLSKTISTYNDANTLDIRLIDGNFRPVKWPIKMPTDTTDQYSRKFMIVDNLSDIHQSEAQIRPPFAQTRAELVAEVTAGPCPANLSTSTYVNCITYSLPMNLYQHKAMPTLVMYNAHATAEPGQHSFDEFLIPSGIRISFTDLQHALPYDQIKTATYVPHLTNVPNMAGVYKDYTAFDESIDSDGAFLAPGQQLSAEKLYIPLYAASQSSLLPPNFPLGQTFIVNIHIPLKFRPDDIQADFKQYRFAILPHLLAFAHPHEIEVYRYPNLGASGPVQSSVPESTTMTSFTFQVGGQLLDRNQLYYTSSYPLLDTNPEFPNTTGLHQYGDPTRVNLGTLPAPLLGLMRQFTKSLFFENGAESEESFSFSVSDTTQFRSEKRTDSRMYVNLASYSTTTSRKRHTNAGSPLITKMTGDFNPISANQLRLGRGKFPLFTITIAHNSAALDTTKNRDRISQQMEQYLKGIFPYVSTAPVYNPNSKILNQCMESLNPLFSSDYNGSAPLMGSVCNPIDPNKVIYQTSPSIPTTSAAAVEIFRSSFSATRLACVVTNTERIAFANIYNTSASVCICKPLYFGIKCATHLDLNNENRFVHDPIDSRFLIASTTTSFDFDLLELVFNKVSDGSWCHTVKGDGAYQTEANIGQWQDSYDGQGQDCYLARVGFTPISQNNFIYLNNIPSNTYKWTVTCPAGRFGPGCLSLNLSSDKSRRTVYSYQRTYGLELSFDLNLDLTTVTGFRAVRNSNTNDIYMLLFQPITLYKSKPQISAGPDPTKQIPINDTFRLEVQIAGIWHWFQHVQPTNGVNVSNTCTTGSMSNRGHYWPEYENPCQCPQNAAGGNYIWFTCRLFSLNGDVAGDQIRFENDGNLTGTISGLDALLAESPSTIFEDAFEFKLVKQDDSTQTIELTATRSANTVIISRTGPLNIYKPSGIYTLHITSQRPGTGWLPHETIYVPQGSGIQFIGPPPCQFTQCNVEGTLTDQCFPDALDHLPASTPLCKCRDGWAGQFCDSNIILESPVYYAGQTRIPFQITNFQHNFFNSLASTASVPISTFLISALPASNSNQGFDYAYSLVVDGNSAGYSFNIDSTIVPNTYTIWMRLLYQDSNIPFQDGIIGSMQVLSQLDWAIAKGKCAGNEHTADLNWDQRDSQPFLQTKPFCICNDGYFGHDCGSAWSIGMNNWSEGQQNVAFSLDLTNDVDFSKMKVVLIPANSQSPEVDGITLILTGNKNEPLLSVDLTKALPTAGEYKLKIWSDFTTLPIHYSILSAIITIQSDCDYLVHTIDYCVEENTSNTCSMPYYSNPSLGQACECRVNKGSAFGWFDCSVELNIPADDTQNEPLVFIADGSHTIEANISGVADIPEFDSITSFLSFSLKSRTDPTATVLILFPNFAVNLGKITFLIPQISPESQGYYDLIMTSLRSDYQSKVSTYTPTGTGIVLVTSQCSQCIEANTISCDVAQKYKESPNGPICTCKESFVGRDCSSKVVIGDWKSWYPGQIGVKFTISSMVANFKNTPDPDPFTISSSQFSLVPIGTIPNKDTQNQYTKLTDTMMNFNLQTRFVSIPGSISPQNWSLWMVYSFGFPDQPELPVQFVKMYDVLIESPDDFVFRNEVCAPSPATQQYDLTQLVDNPTGPLCLCSLGYWGPKCKSTFSIQNQHLRWAQVMYNIPIDIQSHQSDEKYISAISFYLVHTTDPGSAKYSLFYDQTSRLVSTKSDVVPLFNTYYLLLNWETSNAYSRSFSVSTITIQEDCEFLKNTVHFCDSDGTATCNIQGYQNIEMGPACICNPGYYGQQCNENISINSNQGWIYRDMIIDIMFTEVSISRNFKLVLQKKTDESIIIPLILGLIDNETYKSTITIDSTYYTTYDSNLGEYKLRYEYALGGQTVSNSLPTILKALTDVEYLTNLGQHCSPQWTMSSSAKKYHNNEPYCTCINGVIGARCELKLGYTVGSNTNVFNSIDNSAEIESNALINIKTEQGYEYPTANRLYAVNLWSSSDEFTLTDPILINTLKAMGQSTLQIDLSSNQVSVTFIPESNSHRFYFLNIVTWASSNQPPMFTAQLLDHIYSTPVFKKYLPPQNMGIISQTFDSAQRTVDISWISQVPRPLSLFPSTVYHAVYLYNFNDNSNSIKPLPDAITQLSFDFTIDSKLYTNIMHIPETAVETFSIKIPPIPNQIGFEIMIVPTVLPPSITSDSPWVAPIIIKFDQTLSDVCSTVTCSNGATCNPYTGLCGATAIVSSATTCSLPCPALMIPSTDCAQCICITAHCRKYTNVAMLYYTPNESKSTEIQSFSTSLFTTFFKNALTSVLQLNQIPLTSVDRPSLYTPQSSFINSQTTPLGIESVVVLPLNPKSSTVVLNAIAVFVTINPFPGQALATDQQIRFRFDSILATLNSKLTSSSQLFIPSTLSQLFTPAFAAPKYPLPTWIKFSIEADRRELGLKTMCQDSRDQTWSPCSLVPTSRHWSQCPASSTQLSDKTLTLGCFDYNNVGWPTKQYSWCTAQYPSFPSTTILPNACIPTSFPPENIPPKPITNISNARITTTITDNKITAGQTLTVTWDYSGVEINTVAIFLLNSQLITQSVSFDNYQSDDETYGHNQFDTLNLENNDQDDSQLISHHFSALTTTTTFNTTSSFLFHPLQVGSSIYLGTFPATTRRAEIIIPIKTQSTTTPAADIQLMVPQDATKKTLVSTSNNNALYQIIESTMCIGGISHCSDPSATCDKYTGQCLCPSGKKMPVGTTDTRNGICVPSCFDLCLNKGTCKFNDVTNTSTCTCPIDVEGTFCETKKTCSQVNCNNHGFILLDLTSGECTADCQCSGNWANPALPFPPNKQCTRCSLLDQCSSVGTDLELTQTDCSKCHCKQGYEGEFCSTRFMYGTMAFVKDETFSLADVIELWPEDWRDFISPNKPSTNILKSHSDVVVSLRPSNQSLPNHDAELEGELFTRLSQPLYLNSHHMTIQASTTTTTPTTLPPLSIYTPITPSQSTKFQLELDLALSLGVNPSYVQLNKMSSFQTITQSSNTQAASQTKTSTTFSVLSATGATTTTTTATGSNNIQDLYSMWDNLSNEYKNTPMAYSPAVADLGQPVVNPVYDPNCSNSATVTCPSGPDPTITPDVPIIPPRLDGSDPSDKGSSTTTIIIAVVVVVAVLLIVGIIALLIKYSHKKQIWCFAPDATSQKAGSTTKNGTSTSDGHDVEMSSAQTAQIESNGASRVDSNAASKTKASKTFDFGGDQKSSDLKDGGASTDPSATGVGSKTTGDLIMVNDEESASLPTGWGKFKHKHDGSVFYVNEDQMISQRNAPGSQVENATGW